MLFGGAKLSWGEQGFALIWRSEKTLNVLFWREQIVLVTNSVRCPFAKNSGREISKNYKALIFINNCMFFLMPFLFGIGLALVNISHAHKKFIEPIK